MNWEKKEITQEQVRSIAGKYGCTTLTASILARRGITSGDSILYYLENDVRFLHNPFMFNEMEDAVDRILVAKEEGEKVLIFGDRDTDGITSTVLLYRELSALGLDVQWRVPVGDDAYGISKEAIDEFAAQYGTLIITVDCGISNNAEIAYANSLGINTIIVDHHNQPDELPEATAILNPKIQNSGYPFSGLSGCGVAYKLISALRIARTNIYKEPICLLHIQPVNEAYIIEAVRIVNMVEKARISETIVPGMVSLSKTKIIPFLQGQQICVWDAPIESRMLSNIFGSGIEFNLFDLAPEISSVIPAVQGLSLIRLKDMSKIGRYKDEPQSELDGFINIFISYLQRKEKISSPADYENLQLVALSTLADLMPLENENRILVKQGLAAINAAPCKGLSDLLARQSLLGRHISTTDLSWQIIPVINAAGRMGKPDIAAALFLENDPLHRQELSKDIVKMNQDRKQLGNDTWIIVEPIARKSFTVYSNNLVVVADSKINRGITGIMANRLASQFKVPAIVMSVKDDETIVGSMRSARNYDLGMILDTCADLFIDHGGHRFAAGFSLKTENFAAFTERLTLFSRQMEFEADTSETVTVDAELPLNYMTPDLLKIVDMFEPYGEQCAQLVFAARRLKISALDIMGKTEKMHAKLTFDCGKHKWPAIFWQAASKVNREFSLNDTVDSVFQIGRNSYNGSETAQLIVTRITRSDA